MPEQTIIIDVREPDEYEVGHVDGALNIPPAHFVNGQFQERLHDVDTDTLIIVYCRSGNRADRAAKVLQSAGYTHVTNGLHEPGVRQLLAENNMPGLD